MSGLKSYHVTFYYLATGMEGVADKRDYGVFRAASKDAAQRQVLKTHFPNNKRDWDWIQGCLTAKEVARG